MNFTDFIGSLEEQVRGPPWWMAWIFKWFGGLTSSLGFGSFVWDIIYYMYKVIR